MSIEKLSNSLFKSSYHFTLSPSGVAGEVASPDGIDENSTTGQVLKIAFEENQEVLCQVIPLTKDKGGQEKQLKEVLSKITTSSFKALECIAFLFQMRENSMYTDPGGLNFLHMAVKQNQITMVTSFLNSISTSQAETLMGRRDQGGDTSFLISCSLGNANAMRLLLENRANPLQKNKSGENCLHIACTSEPEVMQELLKSLSAHEQRVLINEKTSKWGDTPLFSSCYNGAEECTRLLLSAGADPFIFNQEGEFPYTVAVERGHRSTADVIAKKEPKVKGAFSFKRLGSTFNWEIEPFFTGKKVPFSGSQSWVEFDYVFQSLQDLNVRKRFFSRCNQRQYKELTDAFAIATSEDLDCGQIAKRIRSGELTFFPSGWDEHAIVLVFKDNHMVICNRGEGCTKTEEGVWRTFLPFKISSEKVTKELLQQCVKQDDSLVEDAIAFFNSELPKELEGREDLLCKKIEKIAPKPLDGGVCATASAKGALRLGLAFLTNDFDYAKNISKSWATRQREAALVAFKKTSSLYEQAFLEETAAQQEKRLEVRKQKHLRYHLNQLKESISQNGSIKKAMDNFGCLCGQRQRRHVEKSLFTVCKKRKSKLSSEALARRLFLDSTIKRSLKLRAIDVFIDKLPLLDN
jgi:hypothetical protein